MMRDWYKFFLLAVPTQTEATKNLYPSRCLFLYWPDYSYQKLSKFI